MTESTIKQVSMHNLGDIDDVIQALKEVGYELPEYQLSQVRNFNNTYLIISRHVRQQAKQGRFQNNEFLTKFDTRFAYYYIDALRRYLAGEPTPKAWAKAFEATKSDTSPFISMTLGVNAHVNNDIPQVLCDCQAQVKHHADYKLINAVIADSIYETIRALSDDDKMLNPKRWYLQRPYTFAMKRSITLWRAAAWHHFRMLRSGRMSQRQLESYAGWMAGVISKVPL